jgi:hypothetical protein
MILVLLRDMCHSLVRQDFHGVKVGMEEGTKSGEGCWSKRCGLFPVLGKVMEERPSAGIESRGHWSTRKSTQTHLPRWRAPTSPKIRAHGCSGRRCLSLEHVLTLIYSTYRIASAFTAVVNSLVSDVILPPLSLLPFMARNLEEKFAVLRKGPHYKYPTGYNTRQQATDDGAVVWTYG